MKELPYAQTTGALPEREMNARRKAVKQMLTVVGVLTIGFMALGAVIVAMATAYAGRNYGAIAAAATGVAGTILACSAGVVFALYVGHKIVPLYDKFLAVYDRRIEYVNATREREKRIEAEVAAS